MGECINVFANRIKELRHDKELTVRMLAEQLEISHSAISCYENCKREPTLSVLKAYAKYFDTTVDYLIGLSDEKR